MENNQAARIAALEDELAATVARPTATEEKLIKAGATESNQATRIAALEADLAATVANRTPTQTESPRHQESAGPTEEYGDSPSKQGPERGQGGEKMTAVPRNNDGGRPQAATSLRSDTPAVGIAGVAGTSQGAPHNHSPTTGTEHEESGAIDRRPPGSHGSGLAHTDTSSPARFERISTSGDDQGGEPLWADGSVLDWNTSTSWQQPGSDGREAPLWRLLWRSFGDGIRK